MDTRVGWLVFGPKLWMKYMVWRMFGNEMRQMSRA